MKKHNRIIVGIMAVCLMGCMSAVQENIFSVACLDYDYREGRKYTYENLTYIFSEDGTIEITKFDKSATEIVIPEEINRIKVTTIGNRAFYDCNNLISVTIPDSVTSIGSFAFFRCDKLTSIVIPDSVTSIGGMAFNCCDKLTSVKISENMTSINDGTFLGCTGLESINIPESVTSIGREAFGECRNLTEIIIPESVDWIGGNAFYNTAWIKEKQEENPIVIVNGILIDGKKCSDDVVIPDGVTSIGERAFYNCGSLTSVTIPASVQSISNSFSSCRNLESVTILNPECKIGGSRTTISNAFNTEDNEDSYYGTIYGYENSTAQEYAEKCGYKFESLGKAPEKSTGDINGDGEFNVADIIWLQKYLLGGFDTEISNIKNADLNSDGVIDVFDLCLMRQKLIEK